MKTAVVTGAAQGLGLATVSMLAQRAFRVVLIDVQAVDGQLARLRTAGLHVDGISRECGAADVLVNNAGISMIAPAEETTAAQWQKVMSVNLLGPFLLCKYLGAQMLQRRTGSIVNVASVAGLAGISHRSAYCASKHGVIGLTKALAAEWGGRGVRVNAVCPGWIKTEMDTADQGGGAYSEQDIVNRVPMARFAQAQDVAAAIAFLTDAEQSGFVNGVALPVDGGWMADASWQSLRMRTRA